jgi:hypothetical protein
MNISRQDLYRFWSKVSEANENGCRIWTAGTSNEGYGRFRIGEKRWLSHRLVWLINNPDDDIDNLLICHICDTPPCVEYTHLFKGTKKDNNDDKINKGRYRNGLGLHYNCGENHPRAKLTEADVVRIRLLYEYGGRSRQSLAVEYNVSESTIQHIVEYKTWKEVT